MQKLRFRRCADKQHDQHVESFAHKTSGAFHPNAAQTETETSRRSDNADRGRCAKVRTHIFPMAVLYLSLSILPHDYCMFC